MDIINSPLNNYFCIEAFAKVSNVHPPQTPPIKGGEHTPTPLSRGDLLSPLVGEGKGEG
jgi:hypothetical protein